MSSKLHPSRLLRHEQIFLWIETRPNAMLEEFTKPVKDTFNNLKAVAALAPMLNPFAATACLPIAILLSGCNNQASGAEALQAGSNLGGKITGKTVNGVQIPIGTKEAWEITVKYEIDAAKAARENGGKAILVQAVPPSISSGTSSNQEIKATLTCDGRTAQFGKDSFGDKTLLLEVTASSGKALLELKGIVFNRDMRSIKDGGETLSASDRVKFTKPYVVNHESPAFKQFLRTNGLNRVPGETISRYVDKTLTWLANNRTDGHEGDGQELNDALVIKTRKMDCNLSSALVAGILKANGIPVQTKTRVLAKFNGGWDFHSDIAYYDSEQKKWEGVSPAAIISGERQEVISKGSASEGNGLGPDIHPGYQSVMVDLANNVGRQFFVPNWSPVESEYNTHSPSAVSANTITEVPFTITHKITRLKID